MNTHRPLCFLDVDGTVLAENPAHADHVRELQRVITTPVTQKLVNGMVMANGGHTFHIPTEVAFRSPVQQFLQNNHHRMEIVWLTGWKTNTHLIDEMFGIPSHETLPWEVSLDESGKVAAVVEVLSRNPGRPFIWADDVAITSNPDLVAKLPSPNFLVTPSTDTGLSDMELTAMEQFLNHHR